MVYLSTNENKASTNVQNIPIYLNNYFSQSDLIYNFVCSVLNF